MGIPVFRHNPKQFLNNNFLAKFIKKYMQCAQTAKKAMQKNFAKQIVCKKKFIYIYVGTITEY